MSSSPPLSAPLTSFAPPHSEVRRAALFNLIPSPQSLPALITRTLDLDAINRRASFAHVLLDVPCSSLTRSQREEAIGRGLRDREDGVQKAAKKLVAKWAEDAGGVIEVSSETGEPSSS